MNNNSAACVEIQNPEMGELNTSNHIVGNRQALNEAWTRDGYWYFKGVLDKEVISSMKSQWIEYLQRHGLIDQGVNENLYNGSGFEGKDITEAELSRISEFNHNDMHRILTENPKIVATMKELLGDDPFWLPIAEYRANPPAVKVPESRFIYPHQDGFYSRGLEMKICWVPIDTVTRDMGGCAWVEGAHNGPILHDLTNPPAFPIRTDSIPMEGWKTANFEPGDVVIFDLNLPHSGLVNLSKDKFRFSMDIRVTEASGKTPTIGQIVNINEHQVTVLNRSNGLEETYDIVPDTYVRGTDGRKREGVEIPKTFANGETILVNSDNGRTATLVRSIH